MNLTVDTLATEVSETRDTLHRLENEFLCICTRMVIEPKDVPEIKRLVQQGIDWHYLLGTAERHRVLPLLYCNVSKICRELVPGAALVQLRHNFHLSIRNNLLLTGELVRLLELFADQNILVIPYKGPVLAASVYGDLSLRQFGDLDLIVRATDLAAAKDLLLARGYRYETAFDGVAPFSSDRKDQKFVRAEAGIRVELHWAITSRRFSFPLEPWQLWNHLESVRVLGTAVLSPTVEDLLLILCVHGTKHRWERLAWICDVAELVRTRSDLDWDRAMKNAAKLGGRRMLLLGLLLAHRLLKSNLPDQVLKRIRADLTLETLFKQVYDWLWCDEYVPPGSPEAQYFFVKVRERARDRIRVVFFAVCRMLIPTSKDRGSLSLPAFLDFLYYILRPIRLVRDHGLSPLKRILEGLL